jgi:hypothetical protein
MATVTCNNRLTAPLVIDPCNDFTSEGGQVPLRVFDTLHRRSRQGDYETWQCIAPVQKSAWSTHVTRRRS